MPPHARQISTGWDYLNLGNTPWGKCSVDEGTLQGLADDGDPETTVSVEEANTYACPLVTAEQPDSEPQILDHDPGERIP